MTRIPPRVADAPEERPLLLYDGECRFCRMWVDRWSEKWGDNLDFAPSQSVRGRFPEIPRESFAEALQLVEKDGLVTAGAEGALRARAYGKGRRDFALWAYEKIPGLRPLLEAGYRVVAANRSILSPLLRAVHGPDLLRPRFAISAGIFLRMVAFAYFVAFSSFWWQLDGLVGPQGLLPAQRWLDAQAIRLGGQRWFALPTLCWLFGAGKFLHVLCAAGVALSIAAFFRRAQRLCFALLWAGYLSLLPAGQVFLGYQWDALLLETGLLAVLLAAARQEDGRPTEPSRAARWALWWLLARLMFLSAWVKLASGDPSWRHATALQYHFETQPLPTWIGWWAHQLPASVLRLSCVAMFVIEFGAPLILIGARRIRMIAAGATIVLQVIIALTGNYTFFNLLTIALCVLAFDDAWWSRRFGLAPVSRTSGPARIRNRLRSPAITTAAAMLVIASVVVSLPALLRPRFWPGWYESVYSAIAASRLSSSYGLFAVMTTTRPEIIIEGSTDGRNWEPYPFKWKPGDLSRRPGFIAPYQPRMDWQLWFAALSFPDRRQWIANLVERLLEGQPEVTRLFARNPFPKEPPKYIRAILYEYHFTTIAERRRTGNWWKRDPLDFYFRQVSLPAGVAAPGTTRK